MGAYTKLVPVENIITVLTGVPLSSQELDDESNLLSHVMGEPISVAASSSLSTQALETLKQQLPTTLATFGMLELARFVVDAKARSPSHIDRNEIIELLRNEFGISLPISPDSQYRRQSYRIKELIDSTIMCQGLMPNSDSCEEVKTIDNQKTRRTSTPK